MIRVETQDFDTGAEITRLSQGRTDIGAIVSFTGLVRDMAEAPLQEMTLEHYPGMTEKSLQAIESEARARWPLQDCLIIHRYGSLKPGDRIVLVITASAHRDVAFEAARFLMDWLKTQAPFWKQEKRAGAATWVESKPSDESSSLKWHKNK